MITLDSEVEVDGVSSMVESHCIEILPPECAKKLTGVLADAGTRVGAKNTRMVRVASHGGAHHAAAKKPSWLAHWAFLAWLGCGGHVRAACSEQYGWRCRLVRWW